MTELIDGAPGSLSFSSTVTSSVGSARLLYSLAPDSPWVSVAVSGSALGSSAAFTVTVCAVLQSDVVNTRNLWMRAVSPSVSSMSTSSLSLLIATVTSPVGRAVSATV